MVTHHVEQRLEQRVIPATAESAYELLRDPAALATRVAAYFKQRAQALPARVALPLTHGTQPPLLVVSSDGHGVTCLAAGMAFDGTVLPFTVVDAFRARQRDRLRTRMASQRLEALEAEGWNLDRTLEHAYRMTRAQYDRLVLVAPLLGPTVSVSVKAVHELFRLLSSAAGSSRACLPETLAEGMWRLSCEAACGVMAISAEPDENATLVRALATPDCHVNSRANWVVLNRPERMFSLCTLALDRHVPAVVTQWRFLLEFMAMRFPALRAEILDWFRRLSAANAPEPDCSAHGLAVARRALELQAAQTVSEVIGWYGEDPPPELFEPGGMQERLARMAAEPEPFLPRVVQLHAPWGKLLEELDLMRDFSVLPPPRPRPLDTLSAEEHARVCLWRRLLRDHRHAVGKVAPVYRWLLSLAPQEALVPDREPDPAWSLSAGRDYVRRWYPEFADLRKHVPVRRDPKAANVGPNAPCPCGSNKKFKKCCGAA